MTREESHLENIIFGAILGALIGTGLGLTADLLFVEETLLFPGDVVLFAAAVCAALGYFLGEGFVEWLKENWSRFW